MREFHSYEDMSKEDFRALQLKALDILVYFSKFCDEHGLRYYLAGGTLLGAVRHKGFIPWDDDIDIHMPRPDYEKLPSIWKQYANTKKYPLCNTTLKRNYRHHAYSIADSETTLIERKNINDDIVQGIKIDVIPLDGAPKNKLKIEVQLFWAVLYAIYNVQRLPENQGGNGMKTAIKIMLGAVKSPEKRYRIWRRAERHMKKYDFETSSYVKELVASFRTMHCLYPRKNFDESVLLDFEGHKFPAHHYYKMYLENVYHDYMKLPPENERVPKGDIVYANLDESYKKYKGIYYCKKQ